MRKIVAICSFMMLMLALPRASRAQDEPKPNESESSSGQTPRFYRLVFELQELGADDKPINSRMYTTTINTDGHFNGKIRSGSKIPIETASPGEDSKSSSIQFQYIDVGVNFDISMVKEIGHQLSLDVSTDVSSVADTQDPILHQPVIRRNRWQAVVLIPIGKATAIFRSGALDSKNSMQVVVTATPLQ